ncbi:hypothetical protein [Kutzneria buriramensis]|uniref:C1q domain-containing protein n=1 Tax=Kutzneria buriramensis TaxID=1045776 RepID=A0A3E0HEI6_9PSEU|nr:hypothetical protein [Kutzneria buriramensis]REH43652.1 hypothetical protein BCF44_109195 [Kutzneria buriramensis]
MVAMTALTSFVDGNIPHQGDLNNYGTNIDALCQLTTGKTAASGVSSKPLVKVALNANQSIAGNTLTIPSWNAASANTDNMWVVSNPTFLTVRTAGWYAILLQTSWASGTLTERNLGIMINGTTENTNSVAKNDYFGSPADNIYLQVTAYEHLAVGATIYGYVYQTSGGSLNLLSAAPAGTYLSARWDAPY